MCIGGQFALTEWLSDSETSVIESLLLLTLVSSGVLFLDGAGSLASTSEAFRVEAK